jgi:uncharacterized membrane protein
MLEILTALGVMAFVIFAIFIFYIVQTLLVLQKTLKKLDIVLVETDVKLKKLNSFVNTLDNIGDITEKETEKLKNSYNCIKYNRSIDTEELATWLISSIKLGINFLNKR